MNVLAKLEGVDQLEKRLKAMEKKARNELMDEMAKAGVPEIEDPANRDAPGPHIIHKVTKRTKTGIEVSIGPDEAHWHYRFSEFGAGEHEITVKSRRALSFEGDRGVVVTRSVRHPGIVARPFLRKNFDEKKEKAINMMRDVFYGEMVEECEEK